jgi:hypothetical protein
LDEFPASDRKCRAGLAVADPANSLAQARIGTALGGQAIIVYGRITPTPMAIPPAIKPITPMEISRL